MQQRTTLSTAYHKKIRKVPNIFKDQSTKNQYQANMQEWFHTHPCPTGSHLSPDTASAYLQQVSEASTAIGLGGIKWKYKRWKSYRDGWSPFMLANQALYHFLIKVRRHLLGQHGYSKWSLSHVLPNLWPHTFTWEEAIHCAFSGDKDPEAVHRYLATIPHGPTYYRNLTTAPTKEFIASEISKVRSATNPAGHKTKPTT